MSSWWFFSSKQSDRMSSWKCLQYQKYQDMILLQDNKQTVQYVPISAMIGHPLRFAWSSFTTSWPWIPICSSLSNNCCGILNLHLEVPLCTWTAQYSFQYSLCWKTEGFRANTQGLLSKLCKPRSRSAAWALLWKHPEPLKAVQTHWSLCCCYPSTISWYKL